MKTQQKERNMTFDFEYVRKEEIDALLPTLYELMHRNMSAIVPTEADTFSDREGWLAEVSAAVQKPARQIVLIYYGDELERRLAGFFMYAVNSGASVFLMEEIQIEPDYRGSGVFRRLYRWLLDRLPEEVQFVEAYTHPTNSRSQAILEHMGLRRLDDDGQFFHYRGELDSMRRLFS